MKIDYLGHSELIINIENNNGENIRILSDSWLSEYSVADLMQRNPIIEIDYSKFEDIDAIFISHSHMDHFDPYSLIYLSQNLKKIPTLLLPETLEYTKGLIEKYTKFPVQILKNKQDFEFRGITIQGIIFQDYMNTNEADVMTLSVRNNEEIAYAEVDIVPTVSEDGLGYIYELFSERNYKTKVYISTRNELEGNLSIIDIDSKQRQSFAEEYRQKRLQEIYEYYDGILALQDEGIKTNIFGMKGFLRAFIGQGIIYPAKELGSEFLKLHIMKLQENLELEMAAAFEYGIQYPGYVFEGGKRYEIVNGEIKKIEGIPGISYEYFEEKENLKIKVERKIEDKSLNNTRISTENLQKIERYINEKFLPYQTGNTSDSLKNSMIENGRGEYVINIKLDSTTDIISYRLKLGGIGFEKAELPLKEYDEIYWASDLYDFLEGKLELYSNIVQYLEKGTKIRLWACMGANFINNDIVLKKLDYHFQLAIQGKNSKEFVMKYWK